MLKYIIPSILAIFSMVQAQGAVTRYAKVSKKSHYGWVDEGLQEVIFYSGWEIKEKVEGIEAGSLYCMVSINSNSYGKLIELEFEILASGMVFSSSDIDDLFGGTRLEIKGRLFGADKKTLYSIQCRDFDGWYTAEDK